MILWTIQRLPNQSQNNCVKGREFNFESYYTIQGSYK